MVTQQTFEQYPPFGENATRVQPDTTKYLAGFQPSDVLPAEWENWFLNKSSQGITDLNKGLTSVEREIINVLTEYGITPNDSTTAEGSNQLKEAIIKLRPKIATCATTASTQKKDVAATGDVLKTGNMYVITMTNANTYGDGSSTYPTMSINSGTAYPMCDADGKYLKSGAWKAGDIITVIFTGAKFLMFTQAVVDTVTDGNKSPVTSGAVYNAISAAIANAVQALDVSSVGNTNGTKYICAISEADGKISATAANVATTYSGTDTKAISGMGVKAAIDALDVASVGGSKKYISAISETDGKISATASNSQTVVTKNSEDLITSKAVAEYAKNAKSNYKGIELYAHRGLANLAPDCSFAAWEWARKLGFYGVEIDIQETSDHVMVCYHDESLDALTNGTGVISSKTWSQIQALYYDAGANASSYPNLRISRLEELLAWSKKHGIHTLLDVKTISSFTTLAQKIVEYDVVSLTRVCCGYESEIQAVRAVNPYIPVRYWDKVQVASFNDLVDVAKKYDDCDISLAYADLISSIVNYAHTNNVKIATYPDDIVPEPFYAYTYLLNMLVDRATVNTITNSNDFSKVSCKKYSKFPSSEGNLCIYAIEGGLTAGTKSQAYSTSGKFYVDDSIGIIHCKQNVSGSIQQAFWANKGDVIKVTTHVRITSLESVDNQTSREAFSVGYFTPTEQAATTDVTLDESTAYTMGNDSAHGYGSYAGLSYSDVHNWQTYEACFIAKQSGLHCITAGLRNSSLADFNNYIYECANFSVEVYGTGGASAKTRKNWNLIKTFPYSSRVTSCKLHKSTETIGRIYVEGEWDGVAFKAQLGDNTTLLWTGNPFNNVYAMSLTPAMSRETYDSVNRRLSLNLVHAEGQIGSGAISTSSLGITRIFCEA